MKTRRHHNNDGRAQIKSGKTQEQIRAIAKRMGIPYRVAFMMDCDRKLLDEPTAAPEPPK